MLRLMGFVFGSLVALLGLLMFTDLPALAPHRQTVEDGVSLLLDRLKSAPGSRNSTEAKSPPPPRPAPQPIERGSPPTQAKLEQEPPRSNPQAEQPAEPVPAKLPVPPPQPRWHVFWRPFRSEFSANGFAERLQQATGMDFRVTRAGPGRYEVAFAYLDEEQRRSRLTQISAATGLAVVEQAP